MRQEKSNVKAEVEQSEVKPQSKSLRQSLEKEEAKDAPPSVEEQLKVPSPSKAGSSPSKEQTMLGKRSRTSIQKETIKSHCEKLYKATFNFKRLKYHYT